MIRLLLLSFILLHSASANAQLRSSARSLDYGKVEIWKNDTLEVTIQNRANTVAKMLPTYNPNVQLIGPRSIAPGATINYQVVAYPRAKGGFDFNPKFYFSNSAKPVQLSVRGYIKKFDESALYQCPKLENKTKPVVQPILKIRVIDSFTKKILYHAEVELSNPINKLNFEGGYKKVITYFGNYNLRAFAEGYYPKSQRILFDSRNQEFIIPLRPIELIEEEEEIQEEGEEGDYISLEDVNKKETPLEIIEEEVSKEKEEVIEEEIVLKEEPEIIVKEETKIDTIPEIVEIIQDKKELETDPEIVIKKEVIKEDPLKKLGDEYKKAILKPQHIIILADVSFSMRRGGYLENLKLSMLQTLDYLRPEDSLTIITFSTQNTVVADHVGASQLDSLRVAIAEIEASGGTNAKIAFKSAYGVAHRYQSESSEAKVFLFTDGKFNTPGTSANWYKKYVEEHYKPNNYKLNILLFSKEMSDFNYLKPFSEASGGSTSFIEDDIAKILIEGLMK